MQEYPLAAFADDPIYNMKAVTQRTGIPAATLRAWERRYHVLAPRRSDGNYRLYSERDIAILRWLQAQLDAGLSISRAVALLEHLREHDPEATLPAIYNNPGASEPQTAAYPTTNGVANWEQLQAALQSAFSNLDEQRAGEVLSEAFALYSVEDTCARLISPVLTQIGEAWSQQKMGVAQEHFASAYLMSRLMALFNASHMSGGPLILVACAPAEHHELGALMLALLLRRAGHNVCFLGADLPLADLLKTIRERRPRVVAISSVMTHTLPALMELASSLAANGYRPRLVLGGQALSSAEAHTMHFDCDYIGNNLLESVKAIEGLIVSEPLAYGNQAGIVASSAS
jgi:methanogenic corrinoid protein MtbC1